MHDSAVVWALRPARPDRMGRPRPVGRLPGQRRRVRGRARGQV